MGNKDAKKFAKKGFKAGNVYDAYDVMRDLKKEYVGGGGMGGEKNRAGLTYALVSADREGLLETMQGMVPEKTEDPLDKAKATFDRGSTNTLSPDAAKAFGYVDAYEARERGEGKYRGSDVRFGDSDAQKAAAQELADNYKAGVKKRLSPDFKMDKIFT